MLTYFNWRSFLCISGHEFKITVSIGQKQHFNKAQINGKSTKYCYSWVSEKHSCPHHSEIAVVSNVDSSQSDCNQTLINNILWADETKTEVFGLSGCLISKTDTTQSTSKVQKCKRCFCVLNNIDCLQEIPAWVQWSTLEPDQGNRSSLCSRRAFFTESITQTKVSFWSFVHHLAVLLCPWSWWKDEEQHQKLPTVRKKKRVPVLLHSCSYLISILFK